MNFYSNYESQQYDDIAKFRFPFFSASEPYHLLFPQFVSFLLSTAIAFGCAHNKLFQSVGHIFHKTICTLLPLKFEILNIYVTIPPADIGIVRGSTSTYKYFCLIHQLFHSQRRRCVACVMHVLKRQLRTLYCAMTFGIDMLHLQSS